MSFSEILFEVQGLLLKQSLDGWLLFDDHGHNKPAYAFLQIVPIKTPTRRFFYWIPFRGSPIKIVPQIEPYTLDHLPGQKILYRSWKEMEKSLTDILKGSRKIVMEYSPRHALPNVSRVDAGMIDIIRELGVEVVSSANILQKYTSVWSQEQLATHLAAAQALDSIVEATWAHIAHALEWNRSLTEYAVQQFMLEQMQLKGCVTADPPICAVNAHSADPHYCPHEIGSSMVQKGDFILLDLWCKQDKLGAVYADITRVGVAAASPTPLQQQIFHIVKEARDVATRFVIEKFDAQQSVKGWEVDQRCRDVIEKAGYGEFFVHRTGHNIGEDVHGSGTNLDNFETHDFRDILPGTCFSVEPGIYLPEKFGIRLEYDIYVQHDGKIEITGGIQEEIHPLL